MIDSTGLLTVQDLEAKVGESQRACTAGMNSLEGAAQACSRRCHFWEAAFLTGAETLTTIEILPLFCAGSLL